jgi:hypothetical protein
MKPPLDRKGWKLFEDVEGNCIFPIQGEGKHDYIIWLVHGDRRIALQIPHDSLERPHEPNTT